MCLYHTGKHTKRNGNDQRKYLGTYIELACRSRDVGRATQFDQDQMSGKEEIVLSVNRMDDRWLEGWLLKRKGVVCDTL